MKKFIIFTMLLILSATSFSQQTNPSQTLTRADYLTKSKNQKSAAWSLLGGGTALIGIGLLIGTGHEASLNDAATGGVMAVIGALSAIGSIPLFLASARNNSKAMDVKAFFKMERAPIFQNYSMVHTFYPALSIKIKLY